MEKRIAVIGSGNVATHLATAVEGVVQICSPNLANATALAEKVGCDATNSPSGLADADIYIVAVKDDAIATVLESVPTRCRKALWMHTSGSVGKSVFDGLGYDRYGVFYPLQTFSKSVDLDMSRVPFFIEGSDKRTTDEIRQLALSVSTTVYIADSHLRQQMHVAAVFACSRKHCARLAQMVPNGRRRVRRCVATEKSLPAMRLCSTANGLTFMELFQMLFLNDTTNERNQL